MRGIYAPRPLKVSACTPYIARHPLYLPVWKPTLKTHVSEGNWRQLPLIGCKRDEMWNITSLSAFHSVKLSLWWYFYVWPLNPCRASQRSRPALPLGLCSGSVVPQQWPWMASNDDADSARLCPSEFAIKSESLPPTIAIETVSNWFTQSLTLLSHFLADKVWDECSCCIKDVRLRARCQCYASCQDWSSAQSFRVRFCVV